MLPEQTGRLVSARTRFHREAVKPGGVDRQGADAVADKTMEQMFSRVELQIAAATERLVGLLRNWPAGRRRLACDYAAVVRDTAGLADRHLLTEVAMHAYDCLDAATIEGVAVSAAEAACYADALVFARNDACRGPDIERFRPLLDDLERLTVRIVSR